MADTHGFELVVESTAALLTKELRGAWKSAACPVLPGDEGRIPENVDIDESDNISLGGYVVQDGHAQLPQDGLSAALAPDIDGAALGFGLNIQVELKDPPLPSLMLLDMAAQVTARVPIRVPAGELGVFLILDDLPTDNVTAVLTSGDPLAGKLNTLLREYVHTMYEDDGDAFPHNVTQTDLSWNFVILQILIDSYAELYDDLADPAHAIVVTGPSAGAITISIPMYLRLHNIRKSGTGAGFITLQQPIGVETRIVITAPFEQPPGMLRARFDLATVTVDPIAPAGPVHGVEGANYTTNKTTLASLPLGGVDLDALLQTEIRKQGVAMVAAIGLREFPVPTVPEIEGAIATFFHAELERRGRLSVWTPTDAPEVELTIRDVASRVLPTALVIAVNAGDGADLGAMSDFVPAGQEFAIQLSRSRVDAAIAKARVDNALTNGDLPKRMNADDHDVDLRALDVFLVDSAIRSTGEVTVIDAVLGSIDVDASFRSDIGLAWEDLPDGKQRMRDVPQGEPEIDPEFSVALWIIGLLIGVLTGGLGGGVIALIVLGIVQIVISNVAESVGGNLVTDEISGKVIGMSGWPDRLSRIGFVTTHFNNPIVVDTSGLLIAGTVEVISSCENTAVAFADSGGSYSGAAAAALIMTAHTTHVDAAYSWLPGDGSAAQAVRDISHSYVASGRYIAKHTLLMQQPGGVLTRHFAAVDVSNVPPTVDAGPDITVDEGELVTLIGRFRDREYPDTHETSWTFGDHQAPESGVVSETHLPPEAIGTSTVTHAWCDNGDYTVTFTVRDQNGGMAQDTLSVTVRNVAPTVDAGPDLYAYACTPVLLAARFKDPGWCDTHTATWDFGDCSPVQTAIVVETNAAPAAEGVASAAHIYCCCGAFEAICTVTDDDGAAGSDRVRVDVTALGNPGFEDGFRAFGAHRVANAWTPYTAMSRRVAVMGSEAGAEAGAAGSAAGGTTAGYACEECVVHDGQRAQRIAPAPERRAGLYQRLGANPRWTYQVSAFFFLEPGVTGWLGIDPHGGDDPLSPAIRWTSAQSAHDWVQVCTSVVAGAGAQRAVTVFLDVESEREGLAGYLDDVEFVAMQDLCPPLPPPPPEHERLCVDFSKEQPGRVQALTIKGMQFLPAPNDVVLQVGTAGSATVLVLTPAGVQVRFPYPAMRVVARVIGFGGKPATMTVLDAGGGVAGTTQAPTSQGPATLELTGAALVEARLTGYEAVLVELCIERDVKSGRGVAARRG